MIKIKIPKKLCHKYRWHNFVWPNRSKALIAGKCTKCGMNYKDYWALEKAEHPEKYI